MFVDEIKLSVHSGAGGSGSVSFKKTSSKSSPSGGSGGHGGGTTLANATDLGIIVNQVTNGLNGMPGFGLSLSTEDINNISAYVLEDLSPE